MYRFVNFKGFEDATFSLFRPFTLLIGKNGSGKSNAIEGVELLAQLAHGRRLYEISDIGRGGEFELRGGLGGSIRSGHEIARLGFAGSLPFQGHTQNCNYLVSIKATPEPRIASESLKVGDRMFFDTGPASESATSGVLSVRFDNFSQGPNKPTAPVPADRSVLSQYEAFASSKKLEDARSLVETLRAHLRASFVFDPIPSGMRQYDRIGNRVLGRHGANLSAVLYALETGTSNEKATLGRILGWIRQLPEEPYGAFAFVTTEIQDVLFGLNEGQGGIDDYGSRALGRDPPLPCRLNGNGAVSQGSRIIVEELDNGLHPSRTRVLAQAVWEASSRRELNALCTTHNPATLDALTREQLDGVVVAYHDTTTHAARLAPLRDLPRADVLLERGSLGDLVTRRVLDEYLTPDVEEQAKARATSWLKSLP